jgi:hypothetical protein
MSGMSKDLFLAILAMDSYNRGYNAGVGGLSDAKDIEVGSAKIVRASSSFETSEEVEAGFYALAYDIGADGPEGLAGTTVISCRGTDSALDHATGGRAA